MHSGGRRCLVDDRFFPKAFFHSSARASARGVLVVLCTVLSVHCSCGDGRGLGQKQAHRKGGGALGGADGDDTDSEGGGRGDSGVGPSFGYEGESSFDELVGSSGTDSDGSESGGGGGGGSTSDSGSSW